MQDNWINNLAQAEEAQEKSSFLPKVDEQSSLRASLSGLKSLFEAYAETFNKIKPSSSHAIHIYKLADCDDGFLLFRKGSRLIFSIEGKNKIGIRIVKKHVEGLKTYLDTCIEMVSDNPFSTPKWKHKSWPGFIELNRLAKEYMESFIQNSLLSSESSKE